MSRPDPDRLCAVALEAAERAGARHVEARLVRRRKENHDYVDDRVDGASEQRDVGIGVRALVGDSWAHAGTNVLTADSVAGAARRAAELAGATPARFEVDVPAPVTGSYRTPMEVDPFEVPFDQKAELLLGAMAKARVPGVKRVRGGYTSRNIDTLFVATGGTRIEQSITMCGGGLSVIAEKDGVVQTRSLPKSFEGQVVQGGYEHLEALDLPGLAEQGAREVIALTEAAPTPEGETTIVLGGAQLSLQIHESVGHPTELDRVFGEEISLAGASFLLPEALGELRYGSDIVNLTADSTTPLGPGTYGWDDEGTPARREPLVERGQLVGFLSGRDEASRIGRGSAACLRAETWSELPIVRMVNINLEPGEGTLDELIAGVDDGLFIDVNKSWSIDDLRLNFQFSCEVAWEIKGGRLTGRLFRDPVYFGVTPRFWGSCSAIAGPEEWRMWGWMFCGKGDPPQLMHVGHGCAPARFDGVRVGNTA